MKPAATPPATVSVATLGVLLALLGAVGPFSIDTYLPAFPAIGAALNATPAEVQQSITAYLGPFAFMVLWHGAVSDALGRRRVILAGVSCYTLASLLCWVAPNIETLLAGRALQGIASGAGMVVGRAMVRDLLSGPEAQRLMARVAIMFAISPAVAPILGGWIYVALGWRSVFGFLFLFGSALFALCWFKLPETLPRPRRHALHATSLAKSYVAAFTHRRFVMVTGALSLNFGAFFIYVLSAPVFLIDHLGVSPQGFGWMFIPTVSGMMIGSWLSSRSAGKLSPVRTISIAYAIMLTAALSNVLICALLKPAVAWNVFPIALFTVGMSYAMPNLTLLGMDEIPQQRGLAASCQSFAQSMTTSLQAAFVVALLWATPLTLALGMSLFAALGLLCFIGYLRPASIRTPSG